MTLPRVREVDIPTTPIQMLGADMIGPFQENEQGHKYLLNIIDYLSGSAEAFPMKGQTADELITTICREYIPRHGSPRVIVTDNCQCFKAKEWLACAEQAEIEVRHTTQVHPQGNANVERLNRTLKGLLARAIKMTHPNGLCV